MRGFRCRAIVVFIGLFWLYGMLALIAGAAATDGGSGQPSPSGSVSGSGSTSTTYTTTTTTSHGHIAAATSRIGQPRHLTTHRAAELMIFRGTASRRSYTKLALLKRLRDGTCVWLHRRAWVRSGCREVWRHIVLPTGEPSTKWGYTLKEPLKPSSDRIRFYTLFSFAGESGTPYWENFETGRNRNRFEVRR